MIIIVILTESVKFS